MAGGNHNPSGSNQYDVVPKADDPRLKAALEAYHRGGYTNNKLISQMLLAEHGIECGEWSVKRRRAELGLFGSGKTTARLSGIEKAQLVIDAMDRDPQQQRGPRTVKQDIAQRTGIHLSRSFISEQMHVLAPDGFTRRQPHVQDPPRVSLTSAGIHDQWCGDGHDKLRKIGIDVHGLVDKASGFFLYLDIVPNNRLKQVVAYLYLRTIEEQGGIPITSITDCGSETTLQFGFAHALQQAFYPEYNESGLAPHHFSKSINNTLIERRWREFRRKFGDNIVFVFNRGITSGVYEVEVPGHYLLARWLWSTLLRREFIKIKDQLNDTRKRKDKKKLLPSGASPRQVFLLPENYGLINCLRPVDPAVIAEAKEAIGAEALLDFVPPQYAEHAEFAIQQFGGMDAISYENIWDIFVRMLPLMPTDV